MPGPPGQTRFPKRAGVGLALALVMPILLYVGLAGRLVTAGVGYQMDEALYVESAVFLLRGGGGAPPFMSNASSWVSLRSRRLPLMIIPYVGATKAYVALPLFAVFGISAEVARFSGVLLGSLGIAGLVLLVSIRVSPAAGLIAGVALAIHPSYLDFTVFDNGGVSVWMAGMGLMALALVNDLRRRSTLSAILLGVAAGLAVWARANLLWLIASALAAAVLIYGRRVLPNRRRLTALLAGAAMGVAPLVVYELRSWFETLRFISATHRPLSGHQIGQRLKGLCELMVSDGEQRGIWWGSPLPPWQIGVGGVLLALAALSAFVRIRSSDPAVSRWWRAFATSGLFLTGILLTSGLGVGQHHLVAVLPLAVTALAILSIETGRRFRASIPVLAAAAAGLAVLSLTRDVRIDCELRRTGGKGFWSSSINDVLGHLESHPVAPNRLKIVNWGFQNNLYVLSAGSVYGSELFWGATKHRSGSGMTWRSEIEDGGSFLLFRFETGSPAAEGFSDALEQYHGPRREKIFLDRSGSPYATLVEIPPSP